MRTVQLSRYPLIISMKKALVIGSGAFAAFALPLITFAQISDLGDVGTLVIDTINNILIPVLFAVAFIVFLWGAFDAFILGANNGEAKDKGKNLMLWGLIGFFVMISLWGLVKILTNTAPLDNTIDVPSTGVNVGG